MSNTSIINVDDTSTVDVSSNQQLQTPPTQRSGQERAKSSMTEKNFTLEPANCQPNEVPIQVPEAESSGNGHVGNSGIPATEVASESAPDPFDPAALRINQDFSEIGIKKVITTVQCRKPNKQEFVRVRPGDGWALNTLLLEDQENREYYLIDSGFREVLLQECFPARLCVAVNRNGDVFLWLLKLPGSDWRSNRWNESALIASETAETKWVRVLSNMACGCYDVYAADNIQVEPKWPELCLKELLRLCFKDRHITSYDHPFLKKLRGEV